MNSKWISLTLAGLLGLQSVAMAQTDRTAGIGDEQIRTAKQNILAVKADLLALDGALQAAKESILKRDQHSSRLSSSAITGAAIGLGLTAYATFSFRNRASEMSGILGFLAASTGMLLSASSAGMGALDQATAPKVDLKDLNEKLGQAESEVQNAMMTAQDKSSTALLKQLEANLKAVRTTLNGYTESEDSIKKNKLMSQVAQAAGAAITVFGMSRHESRALLIGPLVMSAGNIGQIIGSFSDSEADQVLKEIESTRRSLLSAAMALE